MSEKIVVSKEDLIDVMLMVMDNSHIDPECVASYAIEARAENRRKVIKKLQHLTDMSDAELNDLYWKKEYSGK